MVTICSHFADHHSRARGGWGHVGGQESRCVGGGGWLITHFVLICRQCTKTNLTLLVKYVLSYLYSKYTCMHLGGVTWVCGVSFLVKREFFSCFSMILNKLTMFVFQTLKIPTLNPFLFLLQLYEEELPSVTAAYIPSILHHHLLNCDDWYAHLLWKTDIGYWYWFLLNVQIFIVFHT